ncbi:uncharacterized protein TrAtP1_002608 [Trichoderma atroviride]|uniref:Transferase family protein n=1 Tax=Hypocrea atroviridis (strain ATCC 20476 / IMI 206040) TaxID=452589 RepID=G9P0L5_HYPAI|nr:uncharacterized protein TRIATDRAFT_275866 [Trichoderma atroviride IMI 206040]EHK42386.1 hypothetical protein TRIATDRAFT_275866 [Trichoderma atroviride IMI 206040]UKZ61342.1 hypothetical protein TrAtP1_002608 [Trichoderma atroviride]
MGSKKRNHAGSFRIYQSSPNLLFDEVPINPLDTTNLVKPWVVTYSIYINGRLDSTKLHDSLESLISKKHRILGARLTSALDTFYVPHSESFSRDTLPAVVFTANNHGEKSVKSANPHLPQSDARPDRITLHPAAESLQAFVAAEGTPEQYFPSPKQPELNPPMLKVDVEAFSDATIISVRSPHILHDAKGFERIITGWATAVNSGVEHVPDLAPLGWDPLSGLGDKNSPANDAKNIPRGWTPIVGAAEKQFAANMQQEFASEPRAKSMSIHFPLSEISRLRKEAQVAAPEGVRLSENDVVFAFLARAWASSSSASPSTPTYLMFPIDLRGRLPERFGPDPGSYIHNSVFAVPLLRTFTMEDLRSMSLGDVAMEVRKTVQQLTSEEMERNADWVLANAEQNPIPRGPEGLMFGVSSWRKMKFLDVDFKGAVASGGDGRLVRIWGSASTAFGARGICVVECDDGEGGLWCSVEFPEGDWNRGQFGDLEKWGV